MQHLTTEAYNNFVRLYFLSNSLEASFGRTIGSTSGVIHQHGIQPVLSIGGIESLHVTVAGTSISAHLKTDHQKHEVISMIITKNECIPILHHAAHLGLGTFLHDTLSLTRHIQGTSKHAKVPESNVHSKDKANQFQTLPISPQ